AGRPERRADARQEGAGAHVPGPVAQRARRGAVRAPDGVAARGRRPAGPHDDAARRAGPGRGVRRGAGPQAGPGGAGDRPGPPAGNGFAKVVELWGPDGAVAKKVAELPSEEGVPIEGVPTGPRGVRWVTHRAATLCWTEALDGGDPKRSVPKRDRIVVLDAPF